MSFKINKFKKIIKQLIKMALAIYTSFNLTKECICTEDADGADTAVEGDAGET